MTKVSTQESFLQSLREDPENGDLQLEYADFLRRKLKNYPLAANHYSKSILLQTKFPHKAHKTYALLLHKNIKQYQEAARHYTQALELQPLDTVTRSNYAQLLMEVGAYKKASKQYRKALQIDNKDAYTHHNYAYLLCNHLHDYELAEKHYKWAVQLKPRSSFYVNYGWLLKNKLNRLEEAKVLFEKALALDPNNSYAKNSLRQIKDLLILKQKQDELNQVKLQKLSVFREWICSALNMEEYLNVFLENGFDGMDVVCEIRNEKDLIQMGITKKGHRLRILRNIQQYRKRNRFDSSSFSSCTISSANTFTLTDTIDDDVKVKEAPYPSRIDVYHHHHHSSPPLPSKNTSPHTRHISIVSTATFGSTISKDSNASTSSFKKM